MGSMSVSSPQTSGGSMMGMGASPLWEEESPYFSERVHDSMGKIKNLSSDIKDLIKGMKEYCKAATAMGTASRNLARRASSILTSANDSSAAVDKEVEPLLSSFGETLNEIAQAQDTLTHSLTQSFVLPLEEFASTEMDQLVELEHEYSNQKSDFVDSLGKLLRTQVKGGSSKSQLPPGTLAQRATDLGHARRSFEQSRQHLACKVDELDTKYTLELTESIAACLFALQSFHHHSMDLVSSLNPRMEELRVTQTKARTSLHSSKSQWERRAEMLDMLLPVDVAERMLEPVEEARLARAATSSGTNETASAIFDLVDRKYGVLEVQASLRAFFRPRAVPGIHYESFLFMRAPGKLGGTTWLRRWFILDGSKLYYIREGGGDPGAGESMEDGGGSERSLVCDVVLSTVREFNNVAVGGGGGGGASSSASSSSNGITNLASSSEGSQYPYAFEIFSANRKSYLLQAESAHDYTAWITAIRKRIERLLIGGDDRSGTPPLSLLSNQRSNSGNGSRGSKTSSPQRATTPANGFPPGRGGLGEGNSNTDSEHIIRDPMLRELAEQNPTCADCGQPNPDWVSINLGIFFCLNCSGIHRSLGVHISKVRSLVLDSLDPCDLGVLRRIGNERANQLWEHQLLDGWTKPTATDGRAVKEQFIRAKYTWKGFTEIETDEALGLAPAPPTPPTNSSPTKTSGKSSSKRPTSASEAIRVQHYSKVLMDAVACDDLGSALKALVRGGCVKWVDPSNHGRTALHVAAMEGHAECVAFLVQNGADPEAKDSDGLTPIDLATKASKEEVLRYLLK